MTWKKRIGLMMMGPLVITTAAVSAVFVPTSLDGVAAQSSLQTTKFRSEPRLQKLREKLLNGQGADVRPLTFQIDELWDSRTDDRAVALAQRFILDLGGTPVQRGGQYMFRIESLGKSRSENGYFEVADYVATIRDNRSNGRDLIAQSALSVRCTRNGCGARNSQIKELFLRLGE